MEWWQSLVLGVVEGVTEYLPVSSTGHLILAQRALGIEQTTAADAYAICIQAGAILAVVGLYARRIRQVLAGLLGRDPAGLRLAVNLLAAFLPAVAIGLPLEKHIKAALFNLPSIAFAWLVGGLVILAVSWRRRATPPTAGGELDSLVWRRAVVIGLLQCLAMWPGTSRSLVTILGGILVGLNVPAAVEFSFLLGVLTLSGATAKDAVKHGTEMLQAYGPGNLLLGFVVAAVSAAAAVRWMVGYLNRHGLAVFGVYRIAAGIALGAALLAGVVTG